MVVRELKRKFKVFNKVSKPIGISGKSFIALHTTTIIDLSFVYFSIFVLLHRFKTSCDWL